ncbi:asparagine synthase (glutamine-hydrolyzing) [Paenalkalicoccus suaedae]|uniref:asparagine synthase (glutamine-hydrolyzing) n=1 Tax=Paenalkalicoccus suaedae TaxID=2592382 RepID=A0A859FFL5_9BACI|nr:asparagine synthase (glutamine-hydrolyzing) [Paenalkalicoccus suaedae]QKS71005.1 asparagine synthase (glutamine-hydrolyzing) [Paenalkalicoccus suaedae]
MCGITGIISITKEVDPAPIQAMTHALLHRGPDTNEVYKSNHAVFGHTRLTVVDPHNGRQPMSRVVRGSTYTICYNGELYNTEAIRKELAEIGYSFQGHSDTEVLLTAYIEWGEACLKKLNGIFAFAIWNSRDRSLFVARDRLGVKPLFYSYKDGIFLFASEIKALLKHPLISRKVDEEGRLQLLALSPMRASGHAIFRDINELKPAHQLFFNQHNLTISRYWNVPTSKHVDSYEMTVERVRELLTSTVVDQLVSDVPVVTFLSGGIDSSAITAIASDHIRTSYSVEYEENDKHFASSFYQPNRDATYIDLVKQAYHLNHKTIELSQQSLVDSLNQAVIARDLPGMADIDSSLMLFSKEIKKDATVALSGECADEIFGGYPWFFKEAIGFPWLHKDRATLLKKQDQKAASAYTNELYKNTLAETPLNGDELPEEARLKKLCYANIHWFMQTLLERKDRMSMASSLEVRVPFANHEIVEYAWSIPWEWKLAGGREKKLLRDAVTPILPTEIVQRKKSPYPKTHHPAYKDAVQKKMQSIIKQKDSILFDLYDYGEIKELVNTGGESYKEPFFGQLMTGPQLLAYFIQLEYWLKEYNIAFI